MSLQQSWNINVNEETHSLWHNNVSAFPIQYRFILPQVSIIEIVILNPDNTVDDNFTQKLPCKHEGGTTEKTGGNPFKDEIYNVT